MGRLYGELDGEVSWYYIYSDGAKSEPQLGDVNAFFFAPKQN